MKNTCEKTPIFVGGGVHLTYLGKEVPKEVLEDIEKMKQDGLLEVSL